MTFFVGLVLVVSVSAQTSLAKEFFDKGTEYADAEKYQKALIYYNKSLQIIKADNSLKQNEIQSKIYFNIGVCLFQLENFVEAEKEFTKAVTYSSRVYTKAIYSLGLTQIELGKLNVAKKSFRKVLKINKENGEAWFDLAMVLFEEKELATSANAFQNAIKYKSKRFAEARNNLGVIFALQEKLNLAEIEFKKAIVESKGNLIIAKVNLEYCRKYKKHNRNLLLANLKFTDKTGKING
jgi:tetratricopeptide (TPR) repeat protein